MKTGIIIDLFYDNGWCLSCKFTMKMKFASIYVEKYPQIGIKYILLNINTKYIRCHVLYQKRKKLMKADFVFLWWCIDRSTGIREKKMLLPHYRFQVYAFKYYIVCYVYTPVVRSAGPLPTCPCSMLCGKIHRHHHHRAAAERKRQIVPIFPDIYLPFLFTHWLEENK